MSKQRGNMELKELLPNATVADNAVTLVGSKYSMVGGGTASAFGWLTSNSTVAVIGIVVAIGGFIVNYWFQAKKERREIDIQNFNRSLALAEEQRREEIHAAQLKALQTAPIDPY